MTGPEPTSPPNDPRAGALQLRRLHDDWRGASRLHAFDEADALARVEERTTSGHGVDLSDRASRRLLAAGVAPRAFAIRNWSDSDSPQRGRSPEFSLLSCRIFGDDSPRAEAESIACAVEVLARLGLTPQHVKVRISHRDAVRSLLIRRGVEPEHLGAWFPLLHRAGKMSNDDFISSALELGMEAKTALDVLRVLAMSTPFEAPTTQLFLSEQAGGRGPEYFKSLFAELRPMGIADWCVLNLGIVRGGGHYTGMVFEIHDTSGRGRSIAGGGRSEFTIAGRTTAVVGFDMGDTALLDLLRDAALLPDAPSLAERWGAGARVFVTAVDDPDALGSVIPVVAALRHAGVSALGAADPAPERAKAESEARRAGARYAVLIESGNPPAARVFNLDTGSASVGAIPLERLPRHFRPS